MEGNSSHFSLKRGGVGRAHKHAAYVVGAEKYASREDVLHVASGNMPGWAAADPLLFWEAADQHERANGRTYLEEEFAIPRELSPELAKKLVDSWVAKEFGNRHAWMYGIHSKPADDGKSNTHCHLLFSDRILDGIERPPELFFRRPASRYRDRKTGELREPDPSMGGTGKDRRWNDRKIVKELRGRWEAYANEFLAEHRFRPRLDLRSNAERGLDLPEPKIGPAKRRADRWRDNRREDVLAIRQRRRRTREEIQDIKGELREARRERARRDICACQEAPEVPDGITYRSDGTPWYHSPIEALTPERRNGRAVFRWSHGRAAGLVAIIDRGNLLSLAGKTSMPKVRAVIALAKARGWESIRLTGSDEFKRLAVREALREGLKVANPELAEFITTQLQEIQHGRHSGETNPQQRPASASAKAAPRRAFTPWGNSGTDHQGMRVSRRLGPQRMPALRHPGSGHGQPEARNPVLQRPLQGHRDGNHGLHGVRAGQPEIRQRGVTGMDQSTIARPARVELARRWLATAAPLDALEAAKLRADPDRLLQLFEGRPEARQWERIERQHAQGVPEALLGLEIDQSEPTGAFQGVVRHVGKRVWIEPQDRPGVVVSVAPSQPVRPGQQVAVQRNGDHLEVHPIRERDHTPRP